MTAFCYLPFICVDLEVCRHTYRYSTCRICKTERIKLLKTSQRSTKRANRQFQRSWTLPDDYTERSKRRSCCITFLHYVIEIASAFVHPVPFCALSTAENTKCRNITPRLLLDRPKSQSHTISVLQIPKKGKRWFI